MVEELKEISAEWAGDERRSVILKLTSRIIEAIHAGDMRRIRDCNWCIRWIVSMPSVDLERNRARIIKALE